MIRRLGGGTLAGGKLAGGTLAGGKLVAGKLVARKLVAGTLVAGTLVAAALGLAGCEPAAVDDGASSSMEGGAGAGEEVGTTTGEADTLSGSASSGEVAVCLQGGPFVARGGIGVRTSGSSRSSGGSGGSGTSAGTGSTWAGRGGVAERVGGLRWHRYDGCERFVIDLVDGAGAAASGAGSVTAAVLRDVGVVRVTLRDVEGAEPDATDATFAGPLARAAYAVASPEGQWIYVDVHLGAGAEASAAALTDPARVVVDLRPGGGRVPEPAPWENRVVVLTPRPGPATYPLTVTGYARTFESNVVVRLERDGQEVYEDFTTATAWVDAWGHYSFTIPDGPAARVVLHVGEHSARDGTWEGVAVPLDMR